ncbi:hypothetical protein TOK_5211 [Pseudonocardia sp. N23]|nr:alpha/beta hydrolase [Pseudonocardia sp. N23]GAY10849.1 hypothetical protein TOK_5211 [Pseudonocardia sp. N23]
MTPLPFGDRVAVVLPGSGSDARFVRSAFSEPLAAVGAHLIAPEPDVGRGIVAGYRSALDEALRAVRDMASDTDARLLVGGVSLGAHVAAGWAVDRQEHLAGLLLVLPGWTGDPGAAPAALTARATARQVRDTGLDATVAALRASAPGWLADDLARSWAAHGEGLAAALDEAAATPAPDDDVLRGLAVPAGVVGAVDDPVHPTVIAHHWADLLPRARVVATDLVAVGADHAALGRAAVLGWLRAAAG